MGMAPRCTPHDQGAPAFSFIFSRSAFIRSFIFGCPPFVPGAVGRAPSLPLCRCDVFDLKVCNDSGAYAFLDSSRTRSLRSLSSACVLGELAGCLLTRSCRPSSASSDLFRFLDGPLTGVAVCSRPSSSSFVACHCLSATATPFRFSFAHFERTLTLLTHACFAFAA